MLCYTYDGSFDGLLTAIYEVYYRGEDPKKIKSIEGLDQNFLDTYVHISTDYEKSRKVYNSIEKKISRDALENVYCVYLADREEDKDTYIYEYLKFGWKAGSKVDSYLSDDRVLRVHAIKRRVDREVHRMMGFTRFSLLEGNVYYAPIEPDNNILPLLAPHFSKRLPDQNWVIHDLGRRIAAVYNTREWMIADAALLGEIPGTDAREETYRQLWKQFYSNVSIRERFNPSLHRRLLPERYWRHLTEKW